LGDGAEFSDGERSKGFSPFCFLEAVISSSQISFGSLPVMELSGRGLSVDGAAEAESVGLFADGGDAEGDVLF
jgi:hypothetical protein